MLEADPLRLSQVIGNLLTNAAKYTDPRVASRLAARVENAELVIARARQRHRPSPRKPCPTLFTMFSQVNSAIDRAEGGLGIGLALVKAPGGAAWRPRRSAQRRASARAASSSCTCRTRCWRPPGARRETPTRARTSRWRATRRGARRRRQPRCRRERWRWCCASRATRYRLRYNGAEALALGERVRPRAAIIDIGMPGMSGYEVAQRMRLEAWGGNAVLVALTGWGQDQDKEAARAAGFDHHLTKPVDPDAIGKVLDAPAGGKCRERRQLQRNQRFSWGVSPRGSRDTTSREALERRG